MYFIRFTLLLAVCGLAQPTAMAQMLQNRIDFLGEYYWQPLLYNPCFAGSRALPTVGVSGRWSSAYGSNPYTISAFAHTNVDTIRSAFGITTTYHHYDDYSVIGGTRYPTNKRYLDINGLYNYRFVLSKQAVIQVGVQAGILHFDSQDPIYNNPFNPQPVVLLNERAIKFNWGFAALITWRNWYLGATMAHFNQPTFQFTQPGTNHQFSRTMFLQTGYSINIADRFYIQPSVMMQAFLIKSGIANTAFRPLLDINLQLDYQHRLFVGAAYRINGDPYFMSVKAGGRIGKTQLSAAYHFSRNAGNAQRIEATLGLFLWQNNDGVDVLYELEEAE